MDRYRGLQWSVAFLWLWSGVQPIVSAETDSLALLAEVGIGSTWRYPVLAAASVLDVVYAAGYLKSWSDSPYFYLAQWLTVAAYSLIIAVALPQMWLHPFAPLLKNLPVLAVLHLLYRESAAKRDCV